MQKHPEHYRLDYDNDRGSLDDRLEHICRRDIDLLRRHNLIQGLNKLASTEFGDTAARYGVHFETAKVFLALPPKAKLSEIVS